MFISFFPAIARAKEVDAEKVPVFKRRWWHSDERLDARPLIWSLKNHPEEWAYRFPSRALQIYHRPSNHVVWHKWSMDYRLQAECSCSSRKWQRFQKGSVGRAIRAWKRWERATRKPDGVAEQFTSHFIH